MKFVKMTYEQVKEVYELSLVKDFVKEEQKPLIVINILMKLGAYECFGLYDEEKLVAYAFVCVDRMSSCVLLDYLCILEPYRGHGYGSICINFLKEAYQDRCCLAAEVESIQDEVPEEEIQTRKRRIHFYEKNGFKDTGLLASMFGVKLQIMNLPVKSEGDLESLRKDLNILYDRMYYEKQIREQIFLI